MVPRVFESVRCAGSLLGGSSVVPTGYQTRQRVIPPCSDNPNAGGIMAARFWAAFVAILSLILATPSSAAAGRSLTATLIPKPTSDYDPELYNGAGTLIGASRIGTGATNAKYALGLNW